MPLENETIGFDYDEATQWVRDAFVGVLDDDYPENEEWCWVTLVDGGMSEDMATKILDNWA